MLLQVTSSDLTFSTRKRFIIFFLYFILNLLQRVRVTRFIYIFTRMRYLYGAADEKFVKKKIPKKKVEPSYKYFVHPHVEAQPDDELNWNDIPIVFKCTPDKLLNLCAKVVDEIPLPAIYKWTIEDICRWLRALGFKQYQNTFRVNLIEGQKLLLLDASALSAMNIRDFDHIKRLSYYIRVLFYFEMTKFGRSLTLYPEFPNELYKLFRVKTGFKHESVRRSVLWRDMQLIRKKEPNYNHWEILERWMNFEREPVELFGRDNIKETSEKSASIISLSRPKFLDCVCIPGCQCYWKDGDNRPPWRFKCLPHLLPDKEFVLNCRGCVAPCTCRWSSKKYKTNGTLSCLQSTFPQKYGVFIPRSRFDKDVPSTYRLSLS